MRRNREILIIRLLRPNRGKRQWLEQMSNAFQHAVKEGIQAALAVEAVHHAQVHQVVYPLARQRGLPSPYARMVVNEALAQMRYLRKHSDRSLKEPEHGFGLGSNAYRLLPGEQRWMFRVVTQERGKYIWFPLEMPTIFQENMRRVAGDARVIQYPNEWCVRLLIQKLERRDGLSSGLHI